MSAEQSNVRPAPDQVLVDIADYVLGYAVDSALAYETARHCLIDTLGCGLEALEYPACTKLLGPIVPGTVRAERRAGARHAFRARSGAGRLQHRHHDPLARFQRHLARGRMGPSVRQSRRHPRGRRLAVAQCRWRPARRRSRCATCCTAMIKAHEIQGVPRAGEQLQPGRPRSRGAGQGRHRPRWSRSCSGCTRDQIINALSHAWVDGQSLRTYRHAPNTGSRKSWAAGDATSRAVRLALIAQDRRDGLSLALTAKTLGLLRRALSRASRSHSSGLTAATSWRTCCSRFPSPPNSTPRPPSRRR